MSLTKIAEILEDAGVGTRGREIFVNFLPAPSREGILLRDPFGGMTIDHELPGFRQTDFMLISRANGYQASMELMTKAIDALGALKKVERHGLYIHYMRARHEPFAYAPSPSGLVEMIVNIDSCWVIV